MPPPPARTLRARALRVGARLAAAALGAATIAGAAAGPARAAAPEGSTLPDLPWTVLATAVDAVDIALRPLTGLSEAALDASESFAPLAAVGHALGLTGAVLPVAADGLRIAADLEGADLRVPQVSDPGAPPAWQLPDLPDLSGSAALLASGAAAVTDRLDEAIACDCLPFGLTDQLRRVQPDVAGAAWALDSYGPALTAYDALAGYAGPRTVLVVIGNQAEMRPSGGAPLYAAVVTADDGRVTIADKGATSTHFFPPLNRPVTWSGVADNPYFADTPRTQPFVNAGANPDFAVSGAELAAAFEAGGHAPVDGVVFVDLTVLQEVLRLTGPVTVEGIGTVDADTVATQLLDNAYERTDSAQDNAQRQAANDALVDALLGRVAQGLPAMRALQALDRTLAGRHLQVWFRDGELQSTFDALDWTGRLTAPEGSDWLAWFTQSGNPSKTDIRQERSAVRTVTMDGDQAEVVTDYVIVNNNPPTDDPTIDERRGYQATWMKTAVVIYLPPEATDVRVESLDGMKPAPLRGVPLDGDVMTDALGHRFLRFSSWIAPLDQASIRIAYRLPLPDPASYTVVLEPQRSLMPYEATIEVDAPSGVASRGPLPVEERTSLTLP